MRARNPLLVLAQCGVYDASSLDADRGGCPATQNLEVAVALRQRSVRARIREPGQLRPEAIACIERVLERAPWPTTRDTDPIVYLRWSVVMSARG